MRIVFLSVFVFTVIFSSAQDITGVWQGHFRSSNMATRSSLFDDRYKFEVQIAQHGKILEAVTYSYLSSFFYGKAAATGTVNSKTSKVLLQEGKLLEVRNQSGDVCIMTCFLQYSKSGDEEFLEGNFISMNTRDSSNCGRGTVFLRKVPSSDFYKEPFLEKEEARKEKEASKRKDTPMAVLTKPAKPTAPAAASARDTHSTAKANPTKTTAPSVAHAKKPASDKPRDITGSKPTTPAIAKRKAPAKPSAGTSRSPEKAPAPLARISTPHAAQPEGSMDSSAGIGKKFPTVTPRVLLSRTNQLIKSIVVHTNEVVLNIYDDGAIDHDTVSVYLDKKQVISRAMLTDRPIVLTLHLDEGDDYHELVMVAENEGEIPPNTSLMIVKAGDKEYEVRITSTEQKNAVIVFKFEKPK